MERPTPASLWRPVPWETNPCAVPGIQGFTSLPDIATRIANPFVVASCLFYFLVFHHFPIHTANGAFSRIPQANGAWAVSILLSCPTFVQLHWCGHGLCSCGGKRLSVSLSSKSGQDFRLVWHVYPCLGLFCADFEERGLNELLRASRLEKNRLTTHGTWERILAICVLFRFLCLEIDGTCLECFFNTRAIDVSLRALFEENGLPKPPCQVPRLFLGATVLTVLGFWPNRGQPLCFKFAFPCWPLDPSNMKQMHSWQASFVQARARWNKKTGSHGICGGC